MTHPAQPSFFEHLREQWAGLIKAELVAKTDLLVLKAMDQVSSLSFAQGTLECLLKKGQTQKAVWVGQRMHMDTTHAEQMLWECTYNHRQTCLECSSEVFLATLQIIENQGLNLQGFLVPLLIQNDDHWKENSDHVLVGNAIFAKFFNQATLEGHEGLMFKLFDILTNPTLHRSLQIKNMSCVITSCTRVFEKKHFEFLQSCLLQHPKALSLFKDCFPLKVTCLHLPSTPQSDRSYYNARVEVSSMAAAVLSQGREVIFEWLKDPVLSLQIQHALKENPNLAFPMFSDLPQNRLMPLLKPMWKALRDCRTSTGAHLAFMWMYAGPNKTLAKHLFAWDAELLLEPVQGMEALGFLSPDDQAFMDQKILHARLNQKKQGVRNKPSSPPRRM